MVRNLLVAVVLLFLICEANAQKLPSKVEVTAAMKQVNNSWMKRNPSPGNNQWARAAYFTGNLDFYKVYPKQEYFDYAMLWANNNFWLLNGGSTTRNADNQIAGQVYYDLYLKGDPTELFKLIQISESVYRMVNSSKRDDWWWIDALYMAMPVFTRLGILTGDENYFEKMYQLYSNTKNSRKLYNDKEYLWYRDESFAPPYSTPNGEDSYWSRGNGWVLAAHVRVLQLLPVTDLHRAEYIETFQNMAKALLQRQRADGFWNASLDDPKDFGGPETSGTSFFTYGMAWGIQNGLLDSATYYPAVVKAWDGLTKIAVQSDGFLGYVQGVGTNPASSQPVTAQTTADFGVGAFLLAGSEVVKLAPGEMPVPSSLYITSVRVISNTQIEVEFSESVEEGSGLDTANYRIPGVNLTGITIANNGKRALLSVTDIAPGRYQLALHGIKSISGSLIENGETAELVYRGNIVVTASSYEPGTDNKPERTLDFDLNTRWSAQGIGEWILYDLGKIAKVSSVGVAFYKGNERKGNFSISLSTDGVVFKEVFNGQSSGKTNELEEYDFTDTDARYVKITGFGNTASLWNSITETNIQTVPLTVHELDRNVSMRVYPIPAGNNGFYIETNSVKEFNISIYRSNGTLVHSCSIQPESITHTVFVQKELFSGVYVVELQCEGDVSRRKLLVQ